MMFTVSATIKYEDSNGAPHAGSSVSIPFNLCSTAGDCFTFYLEYLNDEACFTWREPALSLNSINELGPLSYYISYEGLHYFNMEFDSSCGDLSFSKTVTPAGTYDHITFDLSPLDEKYDIDFRKDAHTELSLLPRDITVKVDVE